MLKNLLYSFIKIIKVFLVERLMALIVIVTLTILSFLLHIIIENLK